MKPIAHLPPGSWTGVADSDDLFRDTRNERLCQIIGDDALYALASDDPWTYLDELAQESDDLSEDYADLTLEGVYCQLSDLPDGFVCNLADAASIYEKYAGFLEWLLDLSKRYQDPSSAVTADAHAGYRRCFESFLASWERTGTVLAPELQTEVFAKVTFLTAFAAAVEAHVAMAGAQSCGEYAPCETPVEEHDQMRGFLAGTEAEWLLTEHESLFHFFELVLEEGWTSGDRLSAWLMDRFFPEERTTPHALRYLHREVFRRGSEDRPVLFGGPRTPDWMVDQLVREMLDDAWIEESAERALRAIRGDEGALEGVGFYDPMCGTGVFLCHAARRIREAKALKDRDPRAVDAAIARLLHGTDVLPFMVRLARANLSTELPHLPWGKADELVLDMRMGDALPDVRAGDALFPEGVDERETLTVDRIATNVPWLTLDDIRLPEACHRIQQKMVAETLWDGNDPRLCPTLTELLIRACREQYLTGEHARSCWLTDASILDGAPAPSRAFRTDAQQWIDKACDYTRLSGLRFHGDSRLVALMECREPATRAGSEKGVLCEWRLAQGSDPSDDAGMNATWDELRRTASFGLECVIVGRIWD